MLLLPLVLPLLQQPMADATPLRPYALTDVHVVRAETGDVLQHQTLLIEGGKIVAMGSAERMVVPQGFVDLEVQGKFLTPGFVDAHAHFPGNSGLDVPPEDYLRMMVANGITRLRCMRLEEGMSDWSHHIEMGQVVGPHLMLPLGLLSGEGELQGEALDAVLQRNAGRKHGFFKMLGGFEEEAYREVVAKIVDAGFEVVGHLPRGISLTVAAEAGQSGIEHFQGFTLSEDYAEEELVSLVRREKEVGRYHCPTIHWVAVQGGNYDLERLEALPGIEQVAPAQREAWRRWWGDEEELPRRERLQSYRKRMLTLLGEMGRQELPLLLSASDGDYVVPGYSIHEEVALYVEAGLSPQAILQAITSNAAASLHAEGQWGTVAVDAVADLVVLDANPLLDAQALKGVQGTMVGGRWYKAAH
ncbi:MAG: amidohydrolase family protein [Planctomycetota bacterium]